MRILHHVLGISGLLLLGSYASAQQNKTAILNAPAATGVSFTETGQQLNRLGGRGVALADLNGDGCLDAFVANVKTLDGEGDRVYFGDCHGHFTDSGQRLAIPSDWEGTPAVGDVNGDGKPDVVTGNIVWINDGKGHFTAHPELIDASGVGEWGPVKLADLNGDGYLDLVAIADWNSIRIFLNDGKGHFHDTGQKLGSGIVGSLALGDVNGDGVIDIVSGGWRIEGSDYAPTRVWLNDGKGHFTDGGPIDHGENHVHRVALGDVNGDRALDVVLACTTPGAAGKVYLNDGKGHFHDSGQNLAHRWAQSVALGDLSGNGYLDIFFANGEPETGGTPSEVWLNDGKGNFRDSGLRLGNAFSWDVALGDLNNDGRLDAFVVNIRIGDISKNPPVFGGAPAEIWLNTTAKPAAPHGKPSVSTGDTGAQTQPVMRAHGERTHNEVWSYGKQAEPILDKYLRLRYQLMPYIYSLGYGSYLTGAPFMRALFMDFPGDPKVTNIPDEYMFGPAFLVAPVTEQGATSRSVYLPAGCDWYNYWTNERIKGGQTITAAAPIDTIPLFVRAGSIVPLGAAVLSTQQPQAIASIRVYPGADADFTLFSDDGTTYAYEKNAGSVTRLHWDESVQQLKHEGTSAWSGPDSAVVNVVHP